MTKRMEILNQIEEQKKKPPLQCRPGPSCWCAYISFVFNEPQSGDECMTPQSILDVASDKLSTSDRRYLQSLLGRDLEL